MRRRKRKKMSDLNVMRHVTKDITNEAVTAKRNPFPSYSGRLKISFRLSWKY